MGTGERRMQIHECLGVGGFGEVYRIRRPDRDVDEALKVLRDDLDASEEEEAIHRLSDEGRLMSCLTHTGITRPHALVRVGARLGLVMEYIEGYDLAVATQDAPAPVGVALRLTTAVASALDHAWRTRSPETGKPMQLVHRDVKPENVRVTPRGGVKLLDFGIARSTEVARKAHTTDGVLPLTVKHMAPERFGQGQVSWSTDVYALGVTLYRLLLGEHVFDVPFPRQVEICLSEADYERFLTSRLERIAPPEVHDLLAHMLAWKPLTRPSSAEVAYRCKQIARAMPHPGLDVWASGLGGAPTRAAVGPLAGREVPFSLIEELVTEDPPEAESVTVAFQRALVEPLEPYPSTPSQASPVGAAHPRIDIDDGEVWVAARAPRAPSPASAPRILLVAGATWLVVTLLGVAAALLFASSPP